MAVLRYSSFEMQAIISNILQKKVTLLPIGNHELRRHLVYKVNTIDGDFVFKYYYQDTYGGREVSTLRLLGETDIKHAKLIASGTFGEEREWLMMELLEGMPMDKIMHHIPTDQLIDIYKDMGRELGKIHEIKSFDAFGSLSENMTYVKPYKSFRQAFMDSNMYCYNKIKSSDHEAKDYLMHAFSKIESNLHLLDKVSVAKLTHFDYSPRNIFIGKKNDKSYLKAVLDFELSRPWDKNADFSHLILRDFPENPLFEEAFFYGYQEISKLDNNFHKTIDLYMLTLCVNVCSWAKELAPDYFDLAYKKLITLLTESKNLK